MSQTNKTFVGLWQPKAGLNNQSSFLLPKISKHYKRFVRL